MELGDGFLTIWVNGIMAFTGFLACYYIIPMCSNMFISSHLFGIDRSKKTRPKIAEAMGAVCGVVYLMVMFLFIPVPFYRHLTMGNSEKFPHHKYTEYLAALLSICCMIFLGFADDVLDLKWRHKLILPTMASLPLLMVYFVNFNSTTIIVPKPLRCLFGFDLDLGIAYYAYMGMLAVFCVNAINILSGVNGLEAGQSWVICVSVLLHNFIELSGSQYQAHMFSIFFMLPFLGVCSALLAHNWYPSAVFVGDTFCYFAGMTFSVVAILAHFSKTMMLFFVPQVVNFLYSLPQLLRLVPCPRHRMPRYNPSTDKLEMSYATSKVSDLSAINRFAVYLLRTLRLADVIYSEIGDVKSIEISNLTVNNFVLMVCGPLHERTLVKVILVIQVICNALGFLVRYQLAKLFYD